MPLLPIKMTPAYRYGASTPWGGRGLRDVFHKDTPDERTGEALEVSAIDKLNSLDAHGEPLCALLARHGARLTGTEVSSPFPLLLKLLDAREKLSVQVHPGDAYAKRVENKLGKTEAWVILRAEPGAQLVYGVKNGVTREALERALNDGEAVEALLRYVPVKAGEVYYIPSGMVHAIGGGILLYEIQQSSDVTYRFYDWNRMDQDGKKRELHIQKALDVTELSLCPNAVTPTLLSADAQGTHERLLDEKYFGLDRFTACAGFPLLPDTRRFSILTALTDGEIAADRQIIPLPAGHTALLPADGFPLALTGDFLLSFPTVKKG